MRKKLFSIIFIVLLFVFSCTPSKDTLFKRLPSKLTNINFNNLISESEDFNILTNEYIFNGGGVAVSDFNNDGYPDLFFTGNMVSNQLYINKGNLEFQEITQEANLNTDGLWSTGVAIADVNADGWMDIYICAAMHKKNRTNRLYINNGLNDQGIPTFSEKAAVFGLDDNNNSMAASFLDYDQDGDLDLYVLNNEQNENIPTNYRKKITDGSASSNDRLYRNDSGFFTDTTLDAGITIEGYGLSVTPLDVNKDNWVDLFITNDYLTNDLLYVNQKDGTFKNEIEDFLLHQSKFSMGSDAADFNNDGYTDIISLDMLGESHQRKKTTIAKSSFFQNVLNKKWGYQNQHMRNMLFKNNGEKAPFTEIGQYSGVYQTDWSWSPLFIDVDNDGLKDLLITNGFPRDITDMDFANYRLDTGAYTSLSTLLDSIPIIKIPNYAYKNNGDLTFKDKGADWGLNIPSFSNGAVFSDLDLDGDVDYIVNNINDEAFVFENTLTQKKPNQKFLQLNLEGSKENPNGLGSKVVLNFTDGSFQYHEQQLSRGYMSSVDPIIYFGLGTTKSIESLKVLWPGDLVTTVESPQLNKRHIISIKDAQIKDVFEFPFSEKKKENIYKEVALSYDIDYIHKEKSVQDFFRQRLLPHKLSQNGPCLAVGDINGDKIEDFIIGSASEFSPILFLQNKNSSFSSSPLFTSKRDKKYEVESIALIDIENDGDLDLYLVSGGNQFDSESEWYQDRILLNDGKGNFTLDASRLPEFLSNGCVIRPFDYDQDGDIDLFVGSRNKPGSYPLSDPSFLLQNNNGYFKDVTKQLLPELSDLGIVSDAQWADINQDGFEDLVIVGEYSPVMIYLNKAGDFAPLDSEVLKNSYGLWRSIEILDFDQDGDLDMLLGNLGKNNMYNISPDTPMLVSIRDVDGNGSVDPVIFNSQKNENGDWDMYPAQFWDNLTQQSPYFRQEFSSYKAFSNANLEYYKQKEMLIKEQTLQANYSASQWVENLGEGIFRMKPLPESLQLGPINDFLTVESEGKVSVFAVGNDFGGPPFEGNSDAFQGQILQWDKTDKLKTLDSQSTGFNVSGDARDMHTIHLQDGKELILVTQNQDRLLVFKKNKKD